MAAFGSVQNRLPGFINPTQKVQQFQNQQLAGLNAGTSAKVGQATPQSQMPMNAGPAPEIQQSLGRTQDAVRNASTKLVGYAQIQRNRIENERAMAEQARQAALQKQQQVQQANWMKTFSGGTKFNRNYYSQPSYGPMAKGTTVNRVRGLLRHFPSLRITEIGGNRSYDRAHGVPRHANSYHYDTRNPAVDIAGPVADLDRLYRAMRASGRWRQILWRVPGHYNHIHVA